MRNRCAGCCWTETGREGGERGVSEKRVVRETETHRIVIDYLFFKVT